jgi:hypothetical protein
VDASVTRLEKLAVLIAVLMIVAVFALCGAGVLSMTFPG